LIFKPFPPPASGWFMAKGIANWHQVGFWDKSSLMVPVMCKICMFLTVSCTLQNLTVSFRYMNISLVMISLTHSLCFCTEQLIYFIWVVVNVVPLILDRIKFNMKLPFLRVVMPLSSSSCMNGKWSLFYPFRHVTKCPSSFGCTVIVSSHCRSFCSFACTRTKQIKGDLLGCCLSQEVKYTWLHQLLIVYFISLQFVSRFGIFRLWQDVINDWPKDTGFELLCLPITKTPSKQTLQILCPRPSIHIT
jgi:hypothetical protein